MEDSSNDNLPMVAASPPPFRKEAATCRRLEQSSNHDALLAVHRQVLESLVRLHNNNNNNNNSHHPSGDHHDDTRKKEKLRLLRHQRILLASKLAQARQSSLGVMTVGEELGERKRRAAEYQVRPYLHVWKRKRARIGKVSQPQPPGQDEMTTVVQDQLVAELNEQDLARRMQRVRHVKMMAAAFRISGISMMCALDNEQVLALRFDIQVEGHFVACYHCFFDLVVYENNNNKSDDDHDDSDRRNDRTDDSLYLRLVQHTLPPSVPLASILKKTMGGGVAYSIGPLNSDSQWETGQLKNRLQKFAKEMYQACYCSHVRKQSVALLKSFAVAAQEGAQDDNNNNTTQQQQQRVFMIDELTCSDRLDKISFHLKLISRLSSSLQVTLTYKDPMRVQPTNVSVNSLACDGIPRVRNRFFAVEVSEDDDDDDDEDGDSRNLQDHDLIHSATVSFRRLDVRNALEEVVEAMSGW